MQSTRMAGPDPILGEIEISGRIYDGCYNSDRHDFFSVVDFLYGGKNDPDKYRRLYLAAAEGEEHLLLDIGEALNDSSTTFISDYAVLNHNTIGEILERTTDTYNRLKGKRPKKHLLTLKKRLKYLSKLEGKDTGIIELIGGGSIVDIAPPENESDIIIRKIANVVVNPSYRSMKFGTAIFGERTRVASELYDISPDIVTFRTSNPWVIEGVVPNLKKMYSYNYVPAGEAMRPDGRRKVLQFMLFLQAKEDFEIWEAHAKNRNYGMWEALRSYSDSVTGFMNEGIGKTSVKQLKEQCRNLKSFDNPKQLRRKDGSDEKDVKRFIEQAERKNNSADIRSAGAYRKAGSNPEECAFLPDFFAKLVNTLDYFRCDDFEEFGMPAPAEFQLIPKEGVPAVPGQDNYERQTA